MDPLVAISEMQGDHLKEYFVYKDDDLYCEDLKLTDIFQTNLKNTCDFRVSPVFVYSKNQIIWNIRTYTDPMERLKRGSKLNYALKANMNPAVLKIMKDHGCSVTLVSGYELQLALMVGFEPEHMVLNGNGKNIWEIELAVKHGCLLNIDSMFNLQQTINVCHRLDKVARVLLRVNPNIDPQTYVTRIIRHPLRQGATSKTAQAEKASKGVHKYNTTGKSGSKFGVVAEQIHDVTMVIKEEPLVHLVGVHCHLGSTITDINVFRKSAGAMLEMVKQFRQQCFSHVQYINLGGGLGIDYTRRAAKTTKPSKDATDSSPSRKQQIPTPAEVVSVIEEVLNEEDISLILEPGRSLIGNAGVLLTTVLGVKHGHPVNYVVVDGSMTEVLRPALYSAYHHIDLAEPSTLLEATERKVYDVVGPVCESGDFLGKDRYLATPHEGCRLAVFDVGAYCGSMSSNYNMRPRPVEVLVDGTNVEIIRRADTLDDILTPYRTEANSFLPSTTSLPEYSCQ